jgi:hypothetical protein
LPSSYGTFTSKLIPFGFSGFIIIISQISPFGMPPLSEPPRHYGSLSSHSKISLTQRSAFSKLWSQASSNYIVNFLIACGLKVLRFLGQRWSGNLGLCADIILFYGWWWWGSYAPEIGFGFCKLTSVVFFVEMKKNLTIICFLPAIGLPSYGGWQNHGFI